MSCSICYHHDANHSHPHAHYSTDTGGGYPFCRVELVSERRGHAKYPVHEPGRTVCGADVVGDPCKCCDRDSDLGLVEWAPEWMVDGCCFDVVRSHMLCCRRANRGLPSHAVSDDAYASAPVNKRCTRDRTSMVRGISHEFDRFQLFLVVCCSVGRT